VSPVFGRSDCRNDKLAARNSRGKTREEFVCASSLERSLDRALSHNGAVHASGCERLHHLDKLEVTPLGQLAPRETPKDSTASREPHHLHERLGSR